MSLPYPLKILAKNFFKLFPPSPSRYWCWLLALIEIWNFCLQRLYIRRQSHRTTSLLLPHNPQLVALCKILNSQYLAPIEIQALWKGKGGRILSIFTISIGAIYINRTCRQVQVLGSEKSQCQWSDWSGLRHQILTETNKNQETRKLQLEAWRDYTSSDDTLFHPVARMVLKLWAILVFGFVKRHGTCKSPEI